MLGENCRLIGFCQILNIKTMGFFSDIFSATVKTVLTPVAVVKDAVDIIKGEEPNNTKSLLQSAGEDLSGAVDEITGW